MKHGLTAETLRTAEENLAVQASETLGSWRSGEVVLLTMRIERAQQIEERERERAAQRSVACWAEDRGEEADRAGRGLSRRPERVARKLRTSSHGCLWLIERWEWLRGAANGAEGWSDENQSLAFELRGVPLAFRDHPVPADQQVALADRELAALRAHHAKLAPCDAFDRESVRLGLSNEASPELRRVIRYEASLQRRLQWCLDSSAKKVPPTPVAAPKPAPTPAPVARAEPTPARPPAAARSVPAEWLDFEEPIGRFPQGFPAAMGTTTVPLSMIPSGARARVR